MRVPTLSALLLIFLAHGALANDAEALVRRMSEATGALTYDGIFVYVRDGQIDTMRVVHTRNEDGTELERLVSVSGPQGEVTRDGTRVTCTLTDDTGLLEKRVPRDYVGLRLSNPIDQLNRHYEFAIIGNGRVAGRLTHQVSIEPLVQDRYSLRLWIDVASNLLLKSAVIGVNNQVLEQVMFTQLSIGEPLASDALDADLSAGGYTWYTNTKSDSVPDTPVADDFTIGWLPSGFEMKNQQIHSISSNGVPVKNVIYSDGLAVVSVFVEKLVSDTLPLQGYTTMGAVSAFSRVSPPYQITVMGDVPQSTVRRIAASVALNETN